MIPEEHRPAVTRGLRSAFGTDEYEEIRTPSGGLSPSLVYRIIVRGQPYLLRIISQRAWGDPSREFAAMQAGSDAGIAPRILYSSFEDRLLLTDFIEVRPYPEDMAMRMARVLRTLHALPPFPGPARGDYFTTMDGFVRRFQAANVLPSDIADDLFPGYAEVFAIYPRTASDLVSSHNDVKPQNTLFDGESVWLIDWEAAFLNDRYVDLAIVANFFVSDEATEQAYLATYFGEPAGEYRTARFFLMRQLLHMFYPALMVVLLSATGAPVPRLDLDAPDFREYHRRLISGEIPLTTPEQRMEYARVHLARFRDHVRSARFEQAVALIAAHSA